ncbi:glycosyltransferase family 4 protein [Flavihumibacter sp. R14]|nr:glycosyltransferase family 4 protein [Flavihumibacter soli]
MSGVIMVDYCQSIIAAEISNKILVIGPHYKNHRGGIGAVIDVQKDFYQVFNFIPTYRYDTNNLKKALFFGLQLFKVIRYLVTNKQVELIHIHGSVYGSLYRKFLIGLIAKSVFGKKIVNHLHSGAYDSFYNNSTIVGKNVIRRYFELSDAIITVSHPVKDYVSSQFSIANIHVINNVIAKAFAKRNEIRPSIISLLFLGLVGNNKGIFDLLEVLGDHREYFKSKIRLIIGGNGELDRLISTIKENGLEEIVEFKGWVSGQSKQKLLLEADIFILPSYSEGMPISILEAMSYGMPIIATQVGGIPQIVKHDLNGRLVRPGDLMALYQAINYYLVFPNRIQEHGEVSLRIIQEYSPETVMPKVEALYKSLI